MHEFAVTQKVVEIALDIARDAAPDHAPARITAVRVRVGNLTGIAEESMRFYFEAITPGSLAEGAELAVVKDAAVATCRACAWSGEVAPPLDPACPRCGQWALDVMGGRDLLVESIELSLEERSPA